MAVVEEFCYAVKDKWPHALIQFEDFQTDRAFAILEKLQDKVLCFNDDIQVCDPPSAALLPPKSGSVIKCRQFRKA